MPEFDQAASASVPLDARRDARWVHAACNCACLRLSEEKGVDQTKRAAAAAVCQKVGLTDKDATERGH